MTNRPRIITIGLIIACLVVLVLAVIHGVWLTVIAMALVAISQAILLYTDRRS